MTVKQTRRTPYTLICIAAAVLAAAGTAFTLAWMHPGFVECQGYLESVNWVPLYSPGGGVVMHGALDDGQQIEQGELLIALDDRRMQQNLKTVQQDLKTREMEMEYLIRNRNLFQNHRRIEEAELLRLVEADRKLLENASLTRNELEHSRYLYFSFAAGAEREDGEFLLALEQLRMNIESLLLQEGYWKQEIEKTRMTAPVCGSFFSVEGVHGSGGIVMLPGIGPGRPLDEGQLVGYLIPRDSMRARIEIPQHRVGDCRPGQKVLVTPAARSPWRNPPLAGRLLSVMPVAAGGTFSAVVELTISGDILEEIRTLSCGSLTARIDIRGTEFNSRSIWIRWMTAVNSWRNP